MNKELRGRAEAVLLMQECGAWTDLKTLNAAIRIAHHDKQFQIADAYWHEHFSTLAGMFREKFPDCPCRACVSKPRHEGAMKGCEHGVQFNKYCDKCL